MSRRNESSNRSPLPFRSGTAAAPRGLVRRVDHAAGRVDRQARARWSPGSAARRTARSSVGQPSPSDGDRLELDRERIGASRPAASSRSPGKSGSIISSRRQVADAERGCASRTSRGSRSSRRSRGRRRAPRPRRCGPRGSRSGSCGRCRVLATRDRERRARCPPPPCAGPRTVMSSTLRRRSQASRCLLRVRRPCARRCVQKPREYGLLWSADEKLNADSSG